MAHCKYHPLDAATYYCEHCETYHCDHCINEATDKTHDRCFMCDNKVISLGAKYNAEAFWRRLQESFHYPLNKETIIFIIGMAFLTTLVSFLPFAIIWHLMLTGAFMKYCFTCLEKTSRGSFRPPSITAAYDGGIILALKLILMVVIISGILFGIHLWLGVGMATLAGGIIICCIPAILINFAFTESIIEAINPLKVIAIIAAVGLPYGLLLALIMVMLGSVSVISQLIGQELSALTTSLQSVVSNYYTIVTFHIMGYMIFQYQDQFGFIAQQQDKHTTKARSAADKLLAKIEVTVKEGNYDKAVVLFHDAIKNQTDDKRFYNQYFDFLLAMKDKQGIEEYSSFYFKFLNNSQREDLINLSYKKILQAHPKFMPDNPEDRMMLARECQQSGDSRSAVKLLNGLNKSHPTFKKLDIAFALMAEALRNIPNMADKADKFASLSQRLRAAKQKPGKPKQRGKRIPPKNTETNGVIETIKENAKKENGIDYDGGIDFS